MVSWNGTNRHERDLAAEPLSAAATISGSRPKRLASARAKTAATGEEIEARIAL
jgi:hypothetical protein